MILVDGSTLLNVASFVQTYMPPSADKLVKENISKNLIGGHKFFAMEQ
jgi:glutamate decarboxylase